MTAPAYRAQLNLGMRPTTLRAPIELSVTQHGVTRVHDWVCPSTGAWRSHVGLRHPRRTYNKGAQPIIRVPMSSPSRDIPRLPSDKYQVPVLIRLLTVLPTGQCSFMQACLPPGPLLVRCRPLLHDAPRPPPMSWQPLDGPPASAYDRALHASCHGPPPEACYPRAPPTVACVPGHRRADWDAEVHPVGEQ